ncbi:hypothetical protein, partial [Gordonia sp. (in: high G+C Gram-positive bacteria)]|uniref:hypothetical protein n=1 Tax=Gordonia sp. (in: high G+C Gram-positive bacteria) TaxID=84139 RepID=UPI003C711852
SFRSTLSAPLLAKTMAGNNTNRTQQQFRRTAMTQPTTTATNNRPSETIYSDVLAAALAAGVDRAHAIACAIGAVEHDWSLVSQALISADAQHADQALRDAYNGN